MAKVALSGLIYLVLEAAYTDIGEGGPVLLPLGIPTGLAPITQISTHTSPTKCEFSRLIF